MHRRIVNKQLLTIPIVLLPQSGSGIHPRRPVDVETSMPEKLQILLSSIDMISPDVEFSLDAYFGGWKVEEYLPFASNGKNLGI